MKAFLFVCSSTLSILILLYVVASPLIIPVESTATPSITAYNAAARAELRQAVETCRLVLGWTEGTIIYEYDVAAFALCMHPTFKKYNLLTVK